MQRFLLIRFIYAVIALIIFTMVVFGAVRLAGDPSLQFLSSGDIEEDRERIRADLGLDKPIYVQYWIFVSSAARGDFGNSIITRRPVMDSIKEFLPNSVRLVVPSFILAIILSLPLGVMAATNRGKPVDSFARVMAGLGQALPVFWFALMMVQLFVIILGVLPSSGMGDWKHYVMPLIVLTFFHMPGPIRLIRSSMLEVLNSEYVLQARIKGVSERVVVWKHALRNSLIPVLTFGAMYLAIGIAGAIVTETVFAWPGVGRMAYRAIISNDYPVIQTIVLLTAVFVITANFVTDILYAYVDPRIRLKT